MPIRPSDRDIEVAEAAIQFAQSVRATHRRRTHRRADRRVADIEIALIRLKEAMVPLRSAIGHFSYGHQTTWAEEDREIVRRVSQAIQAERRKLHKMKPPRKEDLRV